MSTTSSSMCMRAGVRSSVACLNLNHANTICRVSHLAVFAYKVIHPDSRSCNRVPPISFLNNQLYSHETSAWLHLTMTNDPAFVFSHYFAVSTSVNVPGRQSMKLSAQLDSNDDTNIDDSLRHSRDLDYQPPVAGFDTYGSCSYTSSPATAEHTHHFTDRQHYNGMNTCTTTASAAAAFVSLELHTCMS